jgi:proline iminopeptidase
MNYKTFLMTSVVILSVALSGCKKERVYNEPGNLVPKTVDEDPGLPSIFVNGTQLHSEAFGRQDSAMIVVVHGGPGGDYRYMLHCREFADQGYRVVFYDKRGAGLSKRHPGNTYSMQLMIDDLDAVIKHYKKSPTQKVFILGHSWGAMLASMYVNANHAGEIDGLLLAEPGGLVWEDVMKYTSGIQGFGFFSEQLNDAVYMGQFLSAKEDEHAVLDYKRLIMVEGSDPKDEPTGNTDGYQQVWRLGAVTYNALFEVGKRDKPDWTGNLHLFTKKVLFVYSERNRFYGLEHAQKVSSPYPNVELFKNADAGHDMISPSNSWKHFYPKALSYFNSLK